MRQFLSYIRTDNSISLFRDPTVELEHEGETMVGAYYSLDKSGWHGPARTIEAARNQGREHREWLNSPGGGRWLGRMG